MLIVAYFAALLLNFGDFSRFARDEKAMKVGNFLGLPVNFIVFAIITVIVTAGTVKVFGEAIMDQRNLAGIGNEYKSELLFLRGISPWRPAGQVPGSRRGPDRR